jgi:hypothetical protein
MADIILLDEAPACPLCKEHYVKGDITRKGFLYILSPDRRIAGLAGETATHKCSVCQSLFTIKENGPSI